MIWCNMYKYLHVCEIVETWYCWNRGTYANRFEGQIGECNQIGECIQIRECNQMGVYSNRGIPYLITLPYFDNLHYSGPIQWARGNCALKRSVAARPGLFCGKWPVKTTHPMTLRHSRRATRRMGRICVYEWDVALSGNSRTTSIEGLGFRV